jgi:hypothetical protein
LAFSGAELEYVLTGGFSEIGNQFTVFLELYILRFLIDAICLLPNAEVHALAGGTGPLAPIVYIVELFGEPLTDVLLLVNGEAAPLVKTKFHLTPSGLVPFVTKFVHGAVLGAGKEQQVKDKINTISLDQFGFIGEAVSSDGLLQMSYRDHCLALLLITVRRSKQVARIADIVQMEGSYHYDFTFKLREAYTFVSASADAKVKQFMPSIMPESLFNRTAVQYRGY